MKKIVLALSLAVAALILVSPALLAETDESRSERKPSAADQAFLASLARQVPLAPATAAARKPDEPPIGEDALCDATAFCHDGTTRHCYSNASATTCTAVDSNCSVGQQGYVSCDGVTTWCPPCGGCEPGWCEGESDCAWNCYPCPYTYTCNETYCTDRCRCNFQQCAP